MLIKESKLRQIIKSVIRESRSLSSYESSKESGYLPDGSRFSDLAGRAAESGLSGPEEYYEMMYSPSKPSKFQDNRAVVPQTEPEHMEGYVEKDQEAQRITDAWYAKNNRPPKRNDEIHLPTPGYPGMMSAYVFDDSAHTNIWSEEPGAWYLYNFYRKMSDGETIEGNNAVKLSLKTGW